MNELMLIARSPAEMEHAQQGLTEWVGGKLAEVAADMRDAIQNLALAKERKWKVTGWQNQVAKMRKTVMFYQKVKEAVGAGYYIVPAFPMEMIAVRTAAAYPPIKHEGENHWDAAGYLQPAQALPAGEGEYKNSVASVKPGKVLVKKSGTEKDYEWRDGYKIGNWRDFDFPVRMVKPQLLQALDDAMKAKIFDQVGIMRPQGSHHADPIILGQILSPTKFRPPVTFFIAWWLDTRDIR